MQRDHLAFPLSVMGHELSEPATAKHEEIGWLRSRRGTQYCARALARPRRRKARRSECRLLREVRHAASVRNLGPAPCAGRRGLSPAYDSVRLSGAGQRAEGLRPERESTP